MSNGSTSWAPERMRVRSHHVLAFTLVSIFAFPLYLWDVPCNPPGFYIDESSIAYNAYTIAHSGEDEHGESWPLYFSAFGDYKNPVYIYVLAAVYKATGPSIAVARGLSALLGAVAALLLGLLAFQLTRDLPTGLIVAGSALLTPWLYESSRLVFEVAAYPLVCVLFLLALRRASSRGRWAVLDVALIASTLALLTYTYSIARLLAPLLALGLCFFITRRNLGPVLLTWAAYGFTLVPLLIYSINHPGALLGRFEAITYIGSETSARGAAKDFIAHYLADINPWRWLITGEYNIRDHVPDTPALLGATLVLIVIGAVLIIRRHRREPWWRFQLYALPISVIPAALTVNEFPQLRLIALPVFLLVLTAPAIAWLRERASARIVVAVLVFVTIVQGGDFQWSFHERPPERWYVFDARFAPKVLETALEAAPNGPIYLYDTPGHSGYIQALFYGTLRNLPASRFIRVGTNEEIPPGSVVISTEEDCTKCQLLVRSVNYIVYAIQPTSLSPHPAELSASGLRATLDPNNAPVTLRTGSTGILEVIVHNVGSETWPAVADAEGRNDVSLQAAWLSVDGRPVGINSARARIPYDMEAGDTAGLPLRTTAPDVPATYLLEVMLVQSGTNLTSTPQRIRVDVQPR